MREKSLISDEEIKRIAWLARIELSEEEERQFAKQFDEILQFFRKLQEVDTSGIEPTTHVLNKTGPLREDEERPSLPINKSLLNVLRKERSFIKGPRMF